MTTRIQFKVVKEARGYSIHKQAEMDGYMSTIYSCKDYDDMVKVLQNEVEKQVNAVTEHYRGYDIELDS